jgi:hypothetical protein
MLLLVFSSGIFTDVLNPVDIYPFVFTAESVLYIRLAMFHQAGGLAYPTGVLLVMYLF